MRKRLRIDRGVKVRKARPKKIWKLPVEAMALDVKVEMIQDLIPLGLRYVQEVLE